MKIQMSQVELFSLIKTHLTSKGLVGDVDIAVVAGRKGNPLTVFIGLDEAAQEPKAAKETAEAAETVAADTADVGQTDLFGAV